jgi:hypothetical protein
MSSSRRERRGYAKQMGLLGRKESYGQMTKRFQRSNEAGGYLHTYHLQEIANREIEDKNIDSEEHTSGEPEINPFSFLGKR